LVADQHPTAFVTKASLEDLQTETAGQGLQDPIDVCQDKTILLQVAPAHVFGQTSASGLLSNELVDGLSAITHRQLGRFKQFGGMLALGDQVVDRQFAQCISCRIRPSQVTLHDPTAYQPDAGDRFAGLKMRDIMEL
jgi:hypothetical protein